MVSPIPSPPCARAVARALLEQLEEARQQLARDPDAVVTYPELRVIADARDRHRDVTPHVRVLARVGEQIDHDLLEPDGIDVHHDGLRRPHERHLVLAAGELAPDGLERALRDGDEIEALLPELDLPLGDARDLEQVVDDAVKVVRLPFHHVELPVER